MASHLSFSPASAPLTCLALQSQTAQTDTPPASAVTEIDELTAMFQQLDLLGPELAGGDTLDRLVSKIVCKLGAELRSPVPLSRELLAKINAVGGAVKTLHVYGLSFSPQKFANILKYFRTAPSLNLRQCHMERHATLGFNHYTALTRLDFSYCKGIDDSVVNNLTRCSGLQELSFKGNRIGDDTLKGVVQFKDLKFLDVGHTSITDRGLEYITQCGNLVGLGIAGCHLRADDVLQLPSPHPQIKMGITKTGFRTVIEQTNLRVIDVFGCTNIRRDDLEFAKQHKVVVLHRRAHKLNLKNVSRQKVIVLDSSRVSFFHLSTQKHAWAYYKGVDFRKCPQHLSQLICEMIWRGSDYLCDFLKFLAKEIDVARLDIKFLELINDVAYESENCCPLNKSMVEILAQTFPHVQRISFERRERDKTRADCDKPRYPPMRITLEGLEALKGFAALTELNMSSYPYAEVRDDHFAQVIASYPKLERLDLSHTAVCDSVLQGLSVCPTLRHLNISGCSGVDDNALLAFVQSCPTIKTILAVDCENISLDILDDIRRAKPDLSIQLYSLQGKNLEVSKILCDLLFDIDDLDEELFTHLREIGKTITTFDFRASFISESETDLQILALDGYKLRSLPEFFPNLTRLNFENIMFAQDTCKAFHNFPHLREIDIAEPAGISDAELREIAQVKGLEYVRLFKCSEVTDAGFTYLVTNCPSLLQLDVLDCPKISKETLDKTRSELAIKGERPLQILNQSDLTFHVENHHGRKATLSLKDSGKPASKEEKKKS
jgi:hypothetical protein